MVRAIRLLLLVLFFGAVPLAHACSCASPGGTCGAAKPTGTLFLGEVLGVRSIKIPSHITGRNDLFEINYAFRIRVTESFAGELHVGETLEVRTGNGGGDCGFDFRIGKKYLIDAATWSDPDGAGITYGTSICSRTRPEGDAGILLAELRTELSRGRQPDLHGQVRSAEGRYGAETALEGITVSLTAERDGVIYRAQTDSRGIYTFPALPSGGYKPSFDLPLHRAIITYVNSEPLHVEIPANDGTGMACHLDVTAGPTGGITGRVMNVSGKGLQGTVSAQRRGEAPEAHPAAHGWSNDGAFSVDFLADGDYTLQFWNYATHLQGTSSAVVQNGAVTGGVVITASRQTR